MLKDLTLEEYLSAVDSELPAPGGGSVASLVGALGAGLSRMLAHLSINKKLFKEADEEKQESFATAAGDIKQYLDALVDGIDGDAWSYQAVVEAYKTKDEYEIQRALKTSAFMAFDIQNNALCALYRIPELIELGNKNVLSDLIAGTILLHACIEISNLNVHANANLLTNEEDKKTFIVEGNECVKKASELKAEILAKIAVR